MLIEILIITTISLLSVVRPTNKPKMQNLRQAHEEKRKIFKKKRQKMGAKILLPTLQTFNHTNATTQKNQQSKMQKMRQENEKARNIQKKDRRRNRSEILLPKLPNNPSDSHEQKPKD